MTTLITAAKETKHYANNRNYRGVKERLQVGLLLARIVLIQIIINSEAVSTAQGTFFIRALKSQGCVAITSVIL